MVGAVGLRRYSDDPSFAGAGMNVKLAISRYRRKGRYGVFICIWARTPGTPKIKSLRLTSAAMLSSKMIRNKAKRTFPETPLQDVCIYIYIDVYI